MRLPRCRHPKRITYVVPKGMIRLVSVSAILCDITLDKTKIINFSLIKTSIHCANNEAQGFFIQIGTIACFMNVSISVYYLLTIKYGWKDGRLMTKRPWFFVPPIVVGLVFAFVGK